MQVTYWNKEIETADRRTLGQIQLGRLREMVDWACKTPFYQKRLSKTGLRSGQDLHGLEDLQRIPFTTKDDLRLSFPYGLLAVNRREVVRIHSSSGTTGIPTVIYYTADDLDRWTDLIARSIVATGAVDEDVFQNMMTYGLFTGGLGLHYGAERVGMTVIPIGGGNTRRQVQTMKDFQTTVLHVTPSYLLHIHGRLKEFEIPREDLALRKAFVGAEPHSENARLRIE
jgi:phenylacetate-CoA ligase